LLKDAAIFFIVIFLANCTALPKPFQHSYKKDNNVLAALKGGGGVRVEIDHNLPKVISKPLSMYIVRALVAYNIPASADPNFFSKHVLSGSLVITLPNTSDPEQATFVWHLKSFDGDEIGVFKQTIQGGEVGWLNSDPELFSIIAQDAARQLQGYLQDNKSLIVSKTHTAGELSHNRNSSDAITKFFLLEFSGATAGGNKTILRSLRYFLNQESRFTVSNARDANYLVRGSAKISEPINGFCNVAIIWTVSSSNGKELGKIKQNNDIPVESLNTYWDQTALSIANGALLGIKNIVDNTLQFGR